MEFGCSNECFTHDFNTNEENYSGTKAIQKCFMYFIDNLALNDPLEMILGFSASRRPQKENLHGDMM